MLRLCEKKSLKAPLRSDGRTENPEESTDEDSEVVADEEGPTAPEAPATETSANTVCSQTLISTPVID